VELAHLTLGRSEVTFYGLSATNSRGQSFTLAVRGAQGLIALTDRLRQAVEHAHLDIEVVPYEEIQVPGDLLAAVIGAHAGSLVEVSLEWFDGERHWQSSGEVLGEPSNLMDSWSILYGDY